MTAVKWYEPNPGGGVGPDESLFVYRGLWQVLDTHAETIEVLRIR